MADKNATFSGRTHRQHRQLRQKLLDWSGHTASWLDQRDIPVHFLRYEDLKQDTANVFLRAMEFSGRPATREEAERAISLADFARLQEQERERGFREASSKGTVFFRRGEAGDWKNELTAEQVARIESAHGPMMVRLGYVLSKETALARAV